MRVKQLSNGKTRVFYNNDLQFVDLAATSYRKAWIWGNIVIRATTKILAAGGTQTLSPNLNFFAAGLATRSEIDYEPIKANKRMIIQEVELDIVQSLVGERSKTVAAILVEEAQWVLENSYFSLYANGLELVHGMSKDFPTRSNVNVQGIVVKQNTNGNPPDSINSVSNHGTPRELVETYIEQQSDLTASIEFQDRTPMGVSTDVTIAGNIVMRCRVGGYEFTV